MSVVRVYGGLEMTKYGPNTNKKGTPKGTRSSDNSNTSDKLYIVDVERIKGYAGLVKSSLDPTHYYVVYPEMIPNGIKLGNIATI